jgi:hypothetical protein
VGVLVNTSEAKQHLRVDNCDEDVYIDTLINAAESHIQSYLNRPLEPWTDDSPPDLVPTSVKQAALLIVGDLYANREAQSEKQYNINPTVQSLLHFHRLDIGL